MAYGTRKRFALPALSDALTRRIQDALHKGRVLSISSSLFTVLEKSTAQSKRSVVAELLKRLPLNDKGKPNTLLLVKGLQIKVGAMMPFGILVWLSVVRCGK